MASSVLFMSFFLLLLHQGYSAGFNYGEALSKSLLYFEAQRSGPLPSNQRVTWRGDSATKDGSAAGVNLVGGYYDAGDNVKFGLPMAFTVTLLSWGVVEFGSKMAAKNELGHALEAIRWGTDYFVKAHPQPHVLYGQVGDGDSDHACWQRPEDMTTPRGAYKIDEAHPGTDLAAETAAAMAAASIAFSRSDPKYAAQLITHSKQLFDFASKFHALYQSSIPEAGNFYASSGYNDEMLWAAAWLHRATGETVYQDFLSNQPLGTGGPRSEFSWDDKFAGAQALVAKLVLEGKVGTDGLWADYKDSVEHFVCSAIQKGDSNFRISPGGLLNFGSWNNLQYVSSSLLLTAVYSKYLTDTSSSLKCPGETVEPKDLISFVSSQVDYILGSNPKKMSYMVGFGDNYPKFVHHRAASIISVKKDASHVACQQGFQLYFNSAQPNPNVLTGAIVGGPDDNDAFTDSRGNFQQAEPTTVNGGAIVGVLAALT